MAKPAALVRFGGIIPLPPFQGGSSTKNGGNSMRKLTTWTLLLALILTMTALPLALAETAATEEKSDHEPITIMDAQRDYRNLIALVKEKYPEINIEVIPYRGRNMSAYCKQQLETGCAIPDIYSTTQAWDTEYQAKYLLDLSQYDVSKQYNAARLDEYLVDGALYLLPFDYSVTGVMYNKSLFERLGISAPASFKELREKTIPALQEKGVILSNTLLDLPGTSFQYFFDICSTGFMNELGGRKWRKSFADVNSDTFAAGNENLAECAAYFQQWIDCGMLNDDFGRIGSQQLLEEFYKGNTAFFIGSVNRYSQNADGTGDQYALLPFLSEEGDQNTYITSPNRMYGLNKELAEPGNEQKLQDALHVLEVLSTQEGYVAMNGDTSNYLSSIANFVVPEGSPYEEALEQIATGHAMNMVYTGWDNYLVTFGEATYDWIAGTKTGEEALAVLDESKREVQAQGGAEVFATATEELDTVQAAQLSGQIFMQATNADAALISYNVYDANIHALMENSYGANGSILPGPMTAEYITIWLPGGWYDTLLTMEMTGAEVVKLAETGVDTRATGKLYPYVYMTADGKSLEDDKTYTVVFAGVSKPDKADLPLVDTGIVGLDAAKAYLKEVGTVSSATLDNSLVQFITPTAE